MQIFYCIIGQMCYDSKGIILTESKRIRSLIWSVDKMKKSIYVLLILTVFLLTGCAKSDQMTSFIPTQSPEEENADVAEDDGITQEGSNAEATPTPKKVHIGQTTPKYVKLDKYGAFLNIRSTPSTDGEQVGFLVHGEKIEVAEITDGWASFVYENAVCYVNADFLVDEQPEYLDPPSPTPSPAVTPEKKPAKTAVKPEI